MQFTTKELSKRTWADFEHYFSRVGSGWCACMLHLRGGHLANTARDYPRREDRLAQNLSEMKERVWQGHANGILVYAGEEPIGWCQFGLVTDLPLAPTTKTHRSLLARDPTSQWRITCFLTDIKYRRQGVAGLALAAAVDAIRARGGGWVEATPIAFSHADPLLPKLRKAHGWRSEQVKEHLESWPSTEIPGIGQVQATHGSGRSGHYKGTMSMFEQLGFTVVGRDDQARSWWWVPSEQLVMRLKV